MDRKELVTILSTDMSKAFDCTYHKEAGSLWVQQFSLDLMRSFFDRKLKGAKINGHSSEWKTMTRGCPQSTALGPLLCNMFQNDMAMYPDDHQLYAAGKTHGTVESVLKTQGHLASSWYKNNFLLANPEKFQSLTLNPIKN